MPEHAKRLEVGDVGTVISHHEPRREATVVKVGSKWAYVEPSHLGRFDRDTGAHDGGRYSSSAAFYTPDRLARRDALSRANEVIADGGLSFAHRGRRWSEDDRFALAAWLEDRFANAPTNGEHR